MQCVDDRTRPHCLLAWHARLHRPDLTQLDTAVQPFPAALYLHFSRGFAVCAAAAPLCAAWQLAGGAISQLCL